MQQRISYMHLRQVHIRLEAGDFSEVIQQNLEILHRSATEPPADAALFSLGLVYADNDFPGRDYNRSLDYFRQLAAAFPESPLHAEAGIWIGILENLKGIQQQGESKPLLADNFAWSGLGFGVAGKPLSVKDLAAAINFNETILARSKGKPPADRALYRLGLLYAHYANPKKDYDKSVNYMKRLVKDFPSSPLVEQARTWLSLFDLIAKLQQVDIEIEQKKKEFSH